MAGIAYQIAHRRVDVVAEVLDQLRVDGETGFALDVEVLAAEVAKLEDPMRRLVLSFGEGYQPDTDPHVLATASAVAHLLNRALTFFPRVRELIREASGRGQIVDGIAHLNAAEAAIRLMRKEFCSRWPMPDELRVKLAKEQIATGQYRVLQPSARIACVSRPAYHGGP